MRIGTWNLDGRWSARHERFLLDAGCDVWLLTEVDEAVALPGFRAELSAGSMARGQRYAAVFSRAGLTPVLGLHPASAAARVEGTTYCSTVLPWRTCGGKPTWPGADHAGKTATAVEQLVGALAAAGDLVWGGDWNHALHGPERAGSNAGRRSITAAVQELGLEVPTEWLPHRLGELSIDHIAVGSGRQVIGAERLDARGLSDHDAYVVSLRSSPRRPA